MADKPFTNSETDDFEKLFTGNEHLRDLFADFITSKKLPKGILIIHGVGGVGKTSLLRIYRLHCKRNHVPVAFASGEESKSAIEILTNWANDLRDDGVTLDTFQKTLENYKTIQRKVENQAKKTQEAYITAEKIGVSVRKSIIGTVISLLPGVTFASTLSGISVDALVDWLSGFLAKSDIDLLLNPTKVLTSDFLKDISKKARKQRLVLMLDTFEQMSALSDWVCDTVQQLDSNILLVIAGREMVNWDRRWSGWLAYAQIVELTPMNDGDMRKLAHRYYAALVGGEPDPNQIEGIIAFARGLPMVVATAVRLWTTYDQKFDIGKQPEIFSDVVNRLLKSVPADLIPFLESASIVRWFNEAILRALTKQEDMEDVKAAYKELSRFSFVKSSKDGLTLHDKVREIFENNIRVVKSKYYIDLHERAAMFFKAKMEQASGEDGWSLFLEWLYHVVRVDEKSGLQKYQQAAESLLGYHQKDKLLTLLSDLDSYISESNVSPNWLTYFRTRIDDLEKDDEVGNLLDRVVTPKKASTENLIKDFNKKAHKFSILDKPLKVFLCHGKEDKPQVRKLYKSLKEIGIRPWFDEEDLKGGQDWELEIIMAVQNSDAVIVCLSSKSVRKTGFIQKEIKMALDAADERPEGKIFLIPARLDECEMPIRLQSKQWVDLFQTNGFERLVLALEELL